MERQQWGTRIGLILAMAGNAIGLGNFLRFPVQVAENGGGAFMIPYFISFILLGIPLMWIEWGLGRYGGVRGHGTAPAIFDNIWNNRMVKYIGVLGIMLPLVILTYYAYIASWTLSYSFSSLMGEMPTAALMSNAVNAAEVLKPFSDHLNNHIGVVSGDDKFFHPSIKTFAFYIFTLVFALWVLSRGVSGGIEKLNKVAIPTLFCLAMVLFVRIITFEAPVGTGASVSEGFAFIWNPDFSGLLNANTWLAAAGQVFFTLSLGFGAILTYASYLKKEEDIALDGLATASLNGFAEVVFGSTIAVVSAVIFFGVAGAKEVAAGGAFNLGLISMPAIFSHMPGGNFFGFLWFLLLYIAAVTSIVALSQPVICYFEDELKWTRNKSVVVYGIFLFLCSLVPIYVQGALGELDFWAGTVGIVVLSLIEIVIFMWVLDSKKAWDEVSKNSAIKVPIFFFYLMKFVTPLILFVILGKWSYDYIGGALEKYKAGEEIFSFGATVAIITLVAILAVHIIVIALTWRERDAPPGSEQE